MKDKKSMSSSSKIHLAKYLKECGNYTKSQVKSLIEQKRVLVNNQYHQLSYIVKECDIIMVDGIILSKVPYVYYLYHKPVGVICTNNLNIKNNIITNGKLLNPNIIDEIEEYTDHITLSLDSLDDNVNDCLGRGIEHSKHILELMEYLKNKDIILKLNSVVTKQNVNNINEIAQVVSIYKIQRWKLFKFISLRGKSVKNKNEFDVENAEFENLINEIKKQRLNCQVIECKEKEIEENYLLINPIGDFIVTINGKDKVICNFEKIDKMNREVFYNELRRKLGLI